MNFRGPVGLTTDDLKALRSVFDRCLNPPGHALAAAERLRLEAPAQLGWSKTLRGRGGRRQALEAGIQSAVAPYCDGNPNAGKRPSNRQPWPTDPLNVCVAVDVMASWLDYLFYEIRGRAGAVREHLEGLKGQPPWLAAAGDTASGALDNDRVAARWPARRERAARFATAAALTVRGRDLAAEGRWVPKLPLDDGNPGQRGVSERMISAQLRLARRA